MVCLEAFAMHVKAFAVCLEAFAARARALFIIAARKWSFEWSGFLRERVHVTFFTLEHQLLEISLSSVWQ